MAANFYELVYTLKYLGAKRLLYVAVQYSTGKVPLSKESCYDSDRPEDENP